MAKKIKINKHGEVLNKARSTPKRVQLPPDPNDNNNGNSFWDSVGSFIMFLVFLSVFAEMCG